MSNDESAMTASLPEPLGPFGGRWLLRYPSLSSRARSRRVHDCNNTAGCPSGQWKRTVNPSAYAYAGSNPAPATLCTVTAALVGRLVNAWRP
jgi:hypothetical protein